MLAQDKWEENKRIFVEYLDARGQRKTPERFAVLEEIYRRNDHFDVESLYIAMKNNNFRVSRATVYNTIDLLEESKLVIRRQFGGAQALFEKAFGFRQHDHLICDDCGTVLEFCDPRMGEIQKTIGELLNFSVDKHSLLLYGKCQTTACAHKTEKSKKTNETPNESVTISQ